MHTKIRAVVISRLVVFVALAPSLLGVVFSSQAQEVEWRRSDYYPVHPVKGPQSREKSAEEWWYDHANSYDPNSAVANLEGFISAGYVSFSSYAPTERDSGGCMELSIDPKHDCKAFEDKYNRSGHAVLAMGLIEKDNSLADPIWYQYYNEGELFRVIQTRDGGYVAVGRTRSTRHLLPQPFADPLVAYNPGRTPGAVKDTFDNGVNCSLDGPDPERNRRNVRHMVVIKTDHDGNLLWQRLYGIAPYYDTSGNSRAAYGAEGQALDVVELASGHLLIVGESVADPTMTFFCNQRFQPVKRAFVLKVTGGGEWVSGKTLGPAGVHSGLSGVARYVSGGVERYVVTGYEFVEEGTFNPYQGCNYYPRAFAAQLTPDLDVEWVVRGFNEDSPAQSTLQQTSHDIAVTTPPGPGDGEILLPLIVDCLGGCLYIGSSGRAKVYRLRPSDGAILGVSDLGPVTAFDLKLRVTPTPDGGFAAVSSKRVEPAPAPPMDDCAYDTSYWGTDAYVGKFNASGVLEWETTFDVDSEEPKSFPKDQKKQECLYSITQHVDGGFVVSGNNSYNFDDSYLAKIGPAPSTVDADLSIQDTPRDVGLEPNPDTGAMWVSEDIWIRHDADGGIGHENPLAGRMNTVYVQVTNRGQAAASGVLKVYWAKASTGLAWDRDWVDNKQSGILYGDKIPVDVPIVNLPGKSSRVFSVPWVVPDPAIYPSGPDGAHFCLLARIETNGSDFGMTFPETSDVNANTKNNNNIAWKNVTIVDGPMMREFVIVRNIEDEAVDVSLAFGSPALAELGGASLLDHASVIVRLGPELFSRWSDAGASGEGVRVAGSGDFLIVRGNATIENIPFEAREMQTIELEFDLKERPELPVRFDFDVVQFSTLGGEATLVGGQRFSMPVEERTVVDLAVSTSDGRTSALAGDVLVYTIEVTNKGKSDAGGAVVEHLVPTGILTADWTCVASGASSCGAGGVGSIQDTVDLRAGDSITYFLNAMLSPTFFGRLVSRTEVLPPPGSSESDHSNNLSIDETLVFPVSGVAASKAVSGLRTKGGVVIYEILLLNGNQVGQSDNPGNEFVDTLPSDLRLIDASATAGTLALDFSTGTIQWNGGISPGGVVTITVEAAIAPEAGVGTLISNQGVVFYDSDGDGSNDTSVPTDDPQRVGSDDATEFLVASVVEVPTLSSVGWWLLVLTLLLLGLWKLRLSSGG